MSPWRLRVAPMSSDAPWWQIGEDLVQYSANV